MGEIPDEPPAGRPVAVFDFDGTLTDRDGFRLFLRQVATRRQLVGAFLRHAPSLLAALRGGARRDRAKERVCGNLLGGRPVEEVEGAARRTASLLLGSGLRPDTVARLRRHVAEGHRVIVVSASFEAYVRPVASALGVDEVIATRWEVGPAGSLTGRLAGPNVRGPMKATLLSERLGGSTVVDVANGDSRGDVELLEMASTAIWVGRRPVRPGRRLRRGLFVLATDPGDFPSDGALGKVPRTSFSRPAEGRDGQ